MEGLEFKCKRGWEAEAEIVQEVDEYISPRCYYPDVSVHE